MMGSPFYYDSLFDDGPGDVVFHDCMWSGICTCCIQLLHQDSFYYINESPDLRVNNSKQQQHPQQQQQQKVNLQQHHHHEHEHQKQNHNTSICNNTATTNQLHHNISININTSPDKAPSSSATSISPDTASSTSTSSPDKAPASSATSISPDHTASSSTSTSPDTASTLSNSTSPKPVRRREHNDSERKRRDHLRNAFNFLRDQVPRFKAINKKPPRIQILHEATLYVQRIMKEAEELERRLEDERAKHEKFQNLY